MQPTRKARTGYRHKGYLERVKNKLPISILEPLKKPNPLTAMWVLSVPSACGWALLYFAGRMIFRAVFHH